MDDKYEYDTEPCDYNPIAAYLCYIANELAELNDSIEKHWFGERDDE